MATVKIKFRPSTVINREGTLYYQIIHERIVRQISTGYKLFPKEWDVVTSSIVFSLETYLQLISSQYFISNKSGIWSLSLIVHSKG